MKHVSSLNKNNTDKNKQHPGKQLDLGLFIDLQDFSENERVVVEVVLVVKHFTRIKTSASRSKQRWARAWCNSNKKKKREEG
jgi:hypothetical protein